MKNYLSPLILQLEINSATPSHQGDVDSRRVTFHACICNPNRPCDMENGGAFHGRDKLCPCKNDTQQ